jgi:hypothetical protein
MQHSKSLRRNLVALTVALFLVACVDSANKQKEVELKEKQIELRAQELTNQKQTEMSLREKEINLKAQELAAANKPAVKTPSVVAPVQSSQQCKTTDPSGTPLNVRATPSGKVLRNIANGKFVSIVEHGSDSKGQQWVLISDRQTNEVMGWVFREFVSCF